MIPLSEAAANLSRAAIGVQKRRQKDALARKHQRKIAAFFRKQKGMVLDQLSQRQYLFTESYRQLSEETTQLTMQNWDRIWDEVEHQTTPELQQIVASASADGLASGADQLRKVLPFDSSKKPGTTFNLANPRAVQFFLQTGGSVSKIAGIQRETGDSLKRVITTALDEGWSYNQTSREIQKLYDGPISRDRAKRIAVYETAQGYEGGNRLFAQSLQDDGVTLEKSYQTSNDDKVSDLCQGNQDDGWIPLDDLHSSGVLTPPGHVNCRCYEIYREVQKD